MAEGVKHDEDKARFDLLSPSFLYGLAEVSRHGAEKYEDRNWEEGILYSRVFAAAQRHLWDFWDGKDIDPESHLHHLYHAGCCIMYLATYEANRLDYQEWDDRPTTTVSINLSMDATQMRDALQKAADQIRGVYESRSDSSNT